MAYRIVICGVGGQGILSTASIIAKAAANEGFAVRQSEIHGMSLRGGAVFANITLSRENQPYSDIIPRGSANMILSMEPLESLRYLDRLAASGVLITDSKPVENIPNYPKMSRLWDEIATLPNGIILNATELARQAGSSHTANAVLIGTASTYLPISADSLLSTLKSMFTRKGEKIVEANFKAFRLGCDFEIAPVQQAAEPEPCLV